MGELTLRGITERSEMCKMAPRSKETQHPGELGNSLQKSRILVIILKKTQDP